MEENMNKLMFIVVSILVIIGVVAYAPKAEAADTKDVIAGVILGGIIGNEIGKNGYRNREPIYMDFPYGSLIVDQPSIRRGYTCHFQIDDDGYPLYATPTCFREGNRFRRGSNRVIPHSQSMKENYPCGSYWGYGCRNLIEELKMGTIRGKFDFTTN